MLPTAWRSLTVLCAAWLAACGPTPGGHGARSFKGLEEAERVSALSLQYGIRYHYGYDSDAYSYGDDSKGNWINIFRMRSGRVLAVRVAGRPTALGEYRGETLWLWDITRQRQHWGRAIPWNTPSRQLSMTIPKVGRFRYMVAVRPRGQDRVLRVEGGGSFFEISLRTLLRGRTRMAAEYAGATRLPGYVRFQTGKIFEYFHVQDLKRATKRRGVARPRYVIIPYDLQGRPIRREHRIGDTGYGLVWYEGVSGNRFIEARLGSRATKDLTPAALFKEQRVSAVTIHCGSGKETVRGSGALVSTDGLILTNAHVAPGRIGTHCQVKLHSKRVLTGLVVARHPTRDLALLRIPGQAGSYTPVALRDRLPAVGSYVVYIGSPALGVELSLGRGLVSGFRKDPRGTYIQLQAPVNPGHSGGPLLDMKGRQVGVLVFRSEQTPGGRRIQSQSYAIPAGVALAFIKRVSRLRPPPR